jgi:hypothetical protein
MLLSLPLTGNDGRKLVRHSRIRLDLERRYQVWSTGECPVELTRLVDTENGDT